jgi:hypothetical protein
LLKNKTKEKEGQENRGIDLFITKRVRISEVSHVPFLQLFLVVSLTFKNDTFLKQKKKKKILQLAHRT